MPLVFLWSNYFADRLQFASVSILDFTDNKTANVCFTTKKENPSVSADVRGY